MILGEITNTWLIPNETNYFSFRISYALARMGVWQSTCY